MSLNLEIAESLLETQRKQLASQDEQLEHARIQLSDGQSLIGLYEVELERLHGQLKQQEDLVASLIGQLALRDKAPISEDREIPPLEAGPSAPPPAVKSSDASPPATENARKRPRISSPILEDDEPIAVKIHERISPFALTPLSTGRILPSGILKHGRKMAQRMDCELYVSRDVVWDNTGEVYLARPAKRLRQGVWLPAPLSVTQIPDKQVLARHHGMRESFYMGRYRLSPPRLLTFEEYCALPKSARDKITKMAANSSTKRGDEALRESVPMKYANGQLRALKFQMTWVAFDVGFYRELIRFAGKRYDDKGMHTLGHNIAWRGEDGGFAKDVGNGESGDYSDDSFEY